ncbi:hypothetical protein [Pseudomonas bohemica]|uniref:hypothetical protein n=1 Tax=Pseudomonas bohemica TaxID=2044872 RepID=UPI000DA625B1|nr:hypothetical protein [Pseudomonas bohemica]
MNILKTIRAWITGLFTKEPVMADETVATDVVDTAVVDTGDTAVVPVAETTAAVAEVPAVQSTDLITKLETILTALGHEFPVFWDEAVALAKKAL